MVRVERAARRAILLVRGMDKILGPHTVTFSNWGAPFTVAAPARSIPYAQVTG